MKLYSIYKDGLDRAWYDSSNIKYSECIDKEGELKVVKVVFSGGRTYEYTGVDVNDYLKFREATSQGSAFNQLIKKYEFTKLDNSDLDLLSEEYRHLTTPGFTISDDGEGSVVVTKYPEGDTKSYNVGTDVLPVVKAILEQIFSDFNLNS